MEHFSRRGHGFWGRLTAGAMTSSPLDRCILAWAVAALTACGGSTAIGGPDAGAGNDSGADICDGPAPIDTPCPVDAPGAGASCATDSRLTCEYGASLDPRCDVLAGCANGSWNVTGPSPSATCPAPPNDASCAATLAAVPRGSACPTADAECTYAAGRCACVPLPTDPSQARWVCDDPAVGCPQPRPRLGSACNEADYAECAYGEYGECSMPGGVMLECVSGYWTAGNPVCP